MEFVSDPSISKKISKMKQRVRWQEPLITERGIDQTRFVLDDGEQDNPEFSFMVIGDSGSGVHQRHHPQRRIAQEMLKHKDDCRFVVHTGDIIYLVGSSEYYPSNFIEPYREFLVGGEHPERITYDKMTFSTPILTTPGNHDYYDLPVVYGLMAQLAQPVRQMFRSRLDMSVGWHGSFQGKAYAQAFLDYLKNMPETDLARHLDSHYTATTETGRCLRYQPGQFTRLPNRYYTFRYGGIDFFALDSNTFNDPSPLPKDSFGEAARKQLESRRQELEKEQEDLVELASTLDPNHPEESERLDDVRTKLEQLDEMLMDINKQLDLDHLPEIDVEQLEWLRQRLIESWHTEGVRGRVVYFHHPPYVTEATKWFQAQTLAIRQNLRRVFNAVAEKVGDLTEGRPVVDLVLNGHAHCLEYLRTENTGGADSYTNWIVCGGSGYSLRRQRQEGKELMERLGDTEGVVARSKLYVGRHGKGSQKRRPYSFLRIDVLEGDPPQFRIQPYISEVFQRQWQDYPLDPFII